MLGRENEETEFKKTVSELREGVISLSSMLNKSGHGIVYFGVKNDGSVFGQPAGENTTTKIANEFKNRLKPAAYPKISVIEADGKSIISVEAYGEESPYSAYGRYFIRCDDQDLEMSQRELENLFQKKNPSYSEWEKSLTPYGEDSVDEDFLVQYIDKANELNRMDYRYKSVSDAMSRLGLMENGRLNNAGLMLFSKVKPITVKLARFATEERITFIDNRLFSGNIFECIEEAYKYIISSINFNAKIIGMERAEKPEIPLEAIREIVVNSFAHMRFSEGDFNEISISPKTVKIYNPGTIALHKDPSEFAQGALGSKLRNPLIAIVLYRNKIIEAFGTGFRRVFDLCRRENVGFSYRTEGLGFAFYFERKNTDLIAKETVYYLQDNPSVYTANPLFQGDQSFLEQRLCEYARRGGGRIMSAASAAKAMCKAEITVRRAIDRLVRRNVMRRKGSRKTGWWELV